MIMSQISCRLYQLWDGMYHTCLLKKAEDDMSSDAPISVSIAILGLLAFSYYVNRVAWGNLCICYCQTLCANAFIIKQTWTVLNKREKTLALMNWDKSVGYFFVDYRDMSGNSNAVQCGKNDRDDAFIRGSHSEKCYR